MVGEWDGTQCTRRWEEEDQIPCGEEDFIANYDAALEAEDDEDDEDDGSDGESDAEDA